MKSKPRYSIGGYKGNQIGPIVQAILNDADCDNGRLALRELVEALYKHVTVWDAETPAPPQDEIEATIVRLQNEGHRYAAAREGISTSDPVVWWILTAGDVLTDTAKKIRHGVARARLLYGDDVFQRASERLRGEAASAPAPTSGWQPIETAPKGYDGQRFHYVLFRGTSRGGSFAGYAYVSGYMDNNRQPVHSYGYKLHITDWMPLPAAQPEGAVPPDDTKKGDL